MTLQEILKAKGLADDVVQAVMDEMKQNKIFTTTHENMDVRYPKLKADHESLTAQHGESTKLIEQLKSGTKDNEALQGKVTSYENTIAQLQEQLKTTKIENAARLALVEAHCTDVDYALFKLKEKGELELDEHDKIKGMDDKLAGLKTQLPAHFETATTQKQIDPHKLPDRKPDGGTMTKAEFLRKPYAERASFAKENPDAYNTIMNS